MSLDYNNRAKRDKSRYQEENIKQQKSIHITDANVKCSYCGKQAEFYFDENYTEAYCSQKCQDLHSIALVKMKKNLKWFGICISISVMLLLLGAFLDLPFDKKYILGNGMALLGITIILFPFCTPETYEKYGYVKTTKIGRLLGGLTVLLGIVFFFIS